MEINIGDILGVIAIVALLFVINADRLGGRPW